MNITAILILSSLANFQSHKSYKDIMHNSANLLTHAMTPCLKGVTQNYKILPSLHGVKRLLDDLRYIDNK